MALKEDSLCLEGHGSLFGNCFSFDAEDSFQRKKDVETTTKTPVPPKTPVKFSPWFRVPREASLVTFKQDRSKCLPLSSLYDRHRRDVNYMHQVFKDVTQVGEGHFGKVYRVISKEDNKVYAVKVSKEIFHNEAERLKRSEEVRKHEMIPVHQNCVRLYNAWEEQGRLFLWLEFCQTSLEAYAGTNHEINESKVWEILLDLLLGLKNLHDNRLVHVDVKLENILMTAEGVCKLADFGLLVDMSQDALPPKNVVEGDGRYLAPELLDGGPCTPAVDVFSLGLCILELAADIVMPGGGEDWQSLRRGEIPLTKTTHLSEELKNIIREMLIPNHLERPNVDKLLKQPRLQQMWCERRKRNPAAQDLKAPMTEVLRRKCGRPDRVLRRPVVSSLFGSKSIMKRRLINTSAPRPLSGTWNMQVSDDELEVATILNEGKLDILASSTPFKPPTPTRSRAMGSLLSSQRTLNFALNDSASSSSPTSSPPTSPTSSRFFPQLRSTSPLNSVGENPPASPVSMDESPCASPDFSLLHHSNSSKESKMNNSMPHDLPAHKSLNGSVASLGRMGRNLLHSFNTSEDSDDEKVQKKKEKKRKEKKRR